MFKKFQMYTMIQMIWMMQCTKWFEWYNDPNDLNDTMIQTIQIIWMKGKKKVGRMIKISKISISRYLVHENYLEQFGCCHMWMINVIRIINMIIG